MKHRLTALLLALSLLLCLLPAGRALADDPPENVVLINGFTLDAAHPYWKNGDQYGSASDWNAYYNAGAQRLQLKNARISHSFTDDEFDWSVPVSCENALTIELIGSNVISAASGTLLNRRSITMLEGGSSSQFDLTVTGTGTLKITCAALTIGSPTIENWGGCYMVGIGCNALSVTGGTVTVETGAMYSDAYDGHDSSFLAAINAESLRVSGSGTSLTARTGTVTGVFTRKDHNDLPINIHLAATSCAISSRGELHVSGGARVTAIAGALNDSQYRDGTNPADAVAIDCAVLTISGGKLTALTSDSDGDLRIPIRADTISAGTAQILAGQASGAVTEPGSIAAGTAVWPFNGPHIALEVSGVSVPAHNAILTAGTQTAAGPRWLFGERSSWQPGSGRSLEFVASPDFEVFENGGRVFVDDAPVAASNYTARDGTTCIALSAAFLETLSAGPHTLLVTFPALDDTLNTVFYVGGTPETGDGTWLYALCALLPLGGAIPLTLALRRRRKAVSGAR